MKDYSKGDASENMVEFLLDIVKNKITTMNREKDSLGKNKVQKITINNKTFILPDISVWKDEEMRVLEMRIEVKSFYDLPKKDSPNKKLNLFPIKIAQLKSYVNLQSEEEVEIRIVVVIKNKNNSCYWSNVYEMYQNMTAYQSSWDNEPALWFNLDDMNFEFDDF